MKNHHDDHLVALSGAATMLRLSTTSVRSIIRAVQAIQAWRHAASTNRKIEEGVTSGKLEDSRLGTLDDLKALGLINDHGFLVGTFEGHEVRATQDWHIAIMGPAGFYKTTSLTLPNVMHLLKGNEAGEGRESIVLLDWKNNELANGCKEGIPKLTGQAPYHFRPYDAANDVQINVFQDLIDNAARGEPIVDDARARLYPFFAEAIAKAGQNQWIEKLALSSIAQPVVVARAYLDPEALTLGGLWDFAHSSFEDVQNFMAVASDQTDIAGGYVAAQASAFLNRYTSDDLKEFRWIMQSMAEAFGLFSPGSRLRTATERTTIDIRSFRMTPQALIISVPDKQLLTAAPAVSAVLDYLVEAAAHAAGPHRLAIFAEEFAALPFNENVVKWVRTYRALGIRFISIVQDRSGFDRFKKNGGYKPFEENAAKITFGISDEAHLRALEQRAGKRAVLIGTDSTSSGARVPGQTRGGHEQLTPVLPASKIAQIGTRQALLDIPGHPLFIIDRKPWWEQEAVASFLKDTRFDS